MSAGGTSSSSYSIILLSLSGRPHALTHKPVSHTRTHAHRGALLCDVSRGLLSFWVAILRKLRSRAYLLGPLAPGPAEALEDMHCHLTPRPVLTAGPETRTSPCTPGLTGSRFDSTPPFVRLLWNRRIPSEEACGGRERVQLHRPQTVGTWRHRDLQPAPPTLPPLSPCARTVSVMSPTVA